MERNADEAVRKKPAVEKQKVKGHGERKRPSEVQDEGM